MKLKIPYGAKELKIEIPDKNILYLFNAAKNNHNSIDEEEIIKNALASPIGSDRLPRIAKGKNSAAILVSDITRPTPSYKFLPFIVDELFKIDIEDIKIIFGLGIHRPHTDLEKRKLVGEYVASKAKLIDSDIKRCIHLGTTSRGTPVEVFREALNTDILIATGNIEYHYFAGYSGGAKALLPGICSKATVSANHSMMLEEGAVAGNYATNPVSLDIKESTTIANIDFMFNVIVDDKKSIIAAVAGDINKAHLKGVKIYDDIYSLAAKKKADLVITSPGGYPKDINLYQAQKALDNVKEIVKEKGKIIFVAECPEGYGEDTFKHWMKDATNYPLLKDRIKEKFVLGGHKAVVVSKMLDNFKIYLYSGFSKKETESMGFKKVENLKKIIDLNISQDKNIKITLVPSGRFVKFVDTD